MPIGVKDEGAVHFLVGPSNVRRPWREYMQRPRVHLHEGVAECLSSRGFPGRCKLGDKVDIGYPAVHRLLESDGQQEVSYPLVTTRLIWPKVAPGEWRFRILPGCISTARLRSGRPRSRLRR